MLYQLSYTPKRPAPLIPREMRRKEKSGGVGSGIRRR